MEPLTRKGYVGIVRTVLQTEGDEDCRGIIELYDTSKDPSINLNLYLMEQVVGQLAPISLQTVCNILMMESIVNFLVSGLCSSNEVVGNWK